MNLSSAPLHFLSGVADLTQGRLLLLMVLACTAVLPAAEIKVLLCTGDFGMWAQDRVAMITVAVAKAAPGQVVWDAEQSFNFVKKLEAPGFAERYDVIACGDIGLGQFTTAAQEAIVRFVAQGGGFIYVVEAKSWAPQRSAPEALPAPLAAILPYDYPNADPLKNVRSDAEALRGDAKLFAGLDFSRTPLLLDDKGQPKPPAKVGPLVLERRQGKGRMLALYGAFAARYNYVSYAKFEHAPGGWDEWPQLGELWSRLVRHAAETSPVLARTRAQLDAAIKREPLAVAVAVDATKEIDDLRAAVFSVVALQQLYNEDGGANEALFLDLNPHDWFDRRTQEVLSNTKGTKADKPAFLRDYRIKGIFMADNSYGSYGQWNDQKYQEQIAAAVAAATAHPDIIVFFQPGNEPPLDQGYFTFHNRIAAGVIAGAPKLQIVGPNKAFNLEGVDPKGMKDFIDACGKNTDVLNWHTYAQPPANVIKEALYWSKYATGKMRTPGLAKVMFTESDAWNTRDSQFNYLMERAFTFLPEKTIIANFQYCMDSRFEGGTYHFGVLQPEGEFSANYNGYWIWRNLRGRMVASTVGGTLSPAARDHVRVIAARSDGGATVTVVAYYDTGHFDGPAKQQAPEARFTLTVQLPAGSYALQRSDAAWNVRKTTEVPGTAEGKATVTVTLAPCQAAAFTWTRK